MKIPSVFLICLAECCSLRPTNAQAPSLGSGVEVKYDSAAQGTCRNGLFDGQIVINPHSESGVLPFIVVVNQGHVKLDMPVDQRVSQQQMQRSMSAAVQITNSEITRLSERCLKLPREENQTLRAPNANLG